MCGLFGMFDYGRLFTPAQRGTVINALARASEERGRDATGIAYFHKDRLHIYKRPLPASRLRLCVPSQTNLVMGHTRAATQGSNRHACNNHPFYGKAGREEFAFAHNGIIYNDILLRESRRLPPTKVETDSYVCVQLLERQKSLSPESIAQMAELTEGSFTFTLLDREHLTFVVGNSPLCLYHLQGGCYLYASTEEILKQSLRKLSFAVPKHEKVAADMGDILQLDANGAQHRYAFRASHLLPPQRWYGYSFFYDTLSVSHTQDRLEELYMYARYVGVDSEEVDALLDYGASIWEVEELLSDPIALRQLLLAVGGECAEDMAW